MARLIKESKQKLKEAVDITRIYEELMTFIIDDDGKYEVSNYNINEMGSLIFDAIMEPHISTVKVMIKKIKSDEALICKKLQTKFDKKGIPFNVEEALQRMVNDYLETTDSNEISALISLFLENE